MTSASYVGSELELFALAFNWKNYYRQILAEYITGDVLEVGAGIGATTLVLCTGAHKRWVCLEPDPALADRIASLVQRKDLPDYCETRVGTVSDLAEHEKFDTIFYIDVLEHIQDDKNEAAIAARCLRPGGHLIVLSPAHAAFYSPFDAAIGHYRRYSKRSLAAVIPGHLQNLALLYVDSFGAVASFCNRYFMNSDMPTRSQILFWDRYLVPLSRFFDRLFLHSLGKSVIGVWRQG
jgi:SAM-dependent methyltransferase